MLVLSTIVSSLLLAGHAVAQYRTGYGSDYGSGTIDNTPVVAAAAAVTSSVLAAAVTTSTSSESTSTSASQSTPSTSRVPVHIVKVSNKSGNLTFEPNNIKACAGSIVEFHFYPKNHSIVQSTFDEPCVPISNSQRNTTSQVFSGFVPVAAANASELPTYTIAINDTKPIWFYCSQGKHCQAGMVGVINAPAANKSRTLASFQALAKQAPANISPGEGGLSTPVPSPSTVSLTTTIVPQSSRTGSPSVNGNGTASSSSIVAQVTTNAASDGVLAGVRRSVLSGGIAGLIAAFGAYVL